MKTSDKIDVKISFLYPFFSIIVGEVEPKHSGCHKVVIGVTVLLVLSLIIALICFKIYFYNKENYYNDYINKQTTYINLDDY